MPMRATLEADFAQFLGELDKAGAKLRAFEPQVARATGQLQRMTDGLDGNKTLQQAAIMVQALDKVGGASTLTDREIRRIGPTIDEAVQKFQRLGKDVPPSLARTKTELDRMRQSTDQAGRAADTLRTKLGGALTAFAGGLGIGVGANVAASLGSTVRDLAGQATALAPLAQSFERLQGGAVNAERTLQSLRGATRGLVSDSDLLRATNSATQLQLSRFGADMSQLTGVAVTLGRAVGRDATSAIDDLVGALGRGSTEVLDNLGIQLKLNEAYDIYGDRIGKTASQLTDLEKKTAFVTIGMERAQEAADRLGEAKLTVFEQGTRVVTVLSDLAVQLLSAGNESDGLAGALGKVADLLDRIRNGVSLAGVGSTLRFAVSSAAEQAQSAIASIPGLGLTPLGVMATINLENIRTNLGASGSDVQSVLRGFGGTPSAPRRGQAAGGRAGTPPRPPRPPRTSGSVTPDELRLRLLRDEEAALRRIGQQIGINLKLTEKVSLFARQGVSALEVGANGLGLGIRTGDVIGSTNPLANSLVGLAPALTSARLGVAAAATTTRTWKLELGGVAQAFAQLAQVNGGLDGVTRGVGTFVTSLESAEQLVTSIGKMFKEDFNFGESRAGKGVAAGLAGGFLGFELGGMFSSRGGGALAGAAGGAAAGASVGGFVGAGIGAVAGGIGGYFGAAGKASELRKLKDLQADQLLAQYGTLEELLTTVGRLGMSQQNFLKRFYGEPKEFAKGVNDLTVALERERRAADELGKSLQRVADVSGVLSPDQARALANVRPGSPGEGLARDFLTQQNDSAMTGLQRFLSAGPLSVAGASGAGDALGQSFEALLAFGVPADEAVRRLSDSIELYRQNAVLAGAGSTEAFDLLDLKLKALTDETMGPFLERAFGGSQALAGFANQGRISEGIFSGLAPSIFEAYSSMELMGSGGVEAVKLLQGPLQNAWQLSKDLGFALTEDQQAILDFAEASGLIGDKFRPATERMALGIDALVDRFDVFLEALGPGLSTAAGKAGTVLEDLKRQGEFPSLPGNPDATWKVNAELAGSMEVLVGEANVTIDLDGDVLADAVIRRMPGRVEFVNG